jgi:hypothetical protein
LREAWTPYPGIGGEVDLAKIPNNMDASDPPQPCSQHISIISTGPWEHHVLAVIVISLSQWGVPGSRGGFLWCGKKKMTILALFI